MIFISSSSKYCYQLTKSAIEENFVFLVLEFDVDKSNLPPSTVSN